MIDLHWIDQLLLAVASAVVAACAPVLMLWMNKHLKLSANSALSNDLDNAVMAAGRIALDALGSVAAHNQTVETKNAAVAKGAAYASMAAQAAIAALGITPESVSAMVGGELGKLLGQSAAPVTPVAAPVAAPSV